MIKGFVMLALLLAWVMLCFGVLLDTKLKGQHGLHLITMVTFLLVTYVIMLGALYSFLTDEWML